MLCSISELDGLVEGFTEELKKNPCGESEWKVYFHNQEKMGHHCCAL